MEDTKKTTQSVDTANTGNNEEKNAGKTFTQTDMDNLDGKVIL